MMSALGTYNRHGRHTITCPATGPFRVIRGDVADAMRDELMAELAVLREREPSEVESECARYRHLYEAESRIRKAQDKELAALKAELFAANCTLRDAGLYPVVKEDGES